MKLMQALVSKQWHLINPQIQHKRKPLFEIILIRQLIKPLMAPPSTSTPHEGKATPSKARHVGTFTADHRPWVQDDKHQDGDEHECALQSKEYALDGHSGAAEVFRARRELRQAIDYADLCCKSAVSRQASGRSGCWGGL